MKRVVAALFVIALLAVVAVAALFLLGGGDDLDEAGSSFAGEGDCTPAAVGDDGGPVVAIYTVDNGNLGEVCFGNTDQVTEDAWDELAQFVPPEELSTLSLFASYESEDGSLAFAGPMDDAHTEFVIAVDRKTAAEDPAELKLTMAHEYAHVLTQVNAQFDPTADPEDCETFWNGTGCFLEGSFIADYVDAFWSDAALDSLPADGSADEDGGEERCLVDPGFLGAYSASHPEEDFAEVFSAYVFGVEVPAGVEPKTDFMDARFELQGYRDRALASSDETPPNNFDLCG